MRVNLAYGQNGLGVDLPDCTEVITTRFVAPVKHEGEAIRRALRQPLACPALAEKVKPADKVVIVHSDITRATPNHRLLPVLLAELEAAGVTKEDITLLNALGTHRPQTDAELRCMLGDHIVDNYRCLQHDAHNDSLLLPVGSTSLGHPVRINRLYMEADVRILTGFIEPHFFAGFSGGPKAVLPALAGAESVLSNHGTDMIAHPKATWGVTTGNPIWEEMLEVALRTKPTFLLNVTLNTDKQITAVFAGSLLEAHSRGCDFVHQSAMVPVDAPFEIVVTTNSGYPLDQNLYQSVKGMSAAHQIIREGGSIVMAAACQDGLPDHGRYASLLGEADSPRRVLEMLARPDFRAQDQWQVQIQAMIQMQAEVFVYSDGLTNEQIRKALFTPCRDIGKTITQLLKRYGPDARACALPEGPQTMAYLTGVQREQL